jgi:hypothetical protein
MKEIQILQHKENFVLLYTITLENRLKYTCLNTNNVNENMVLGLFYNALSCCVFIIFVK